MQQRVSIARALGFEPRLLMMDEPFGALDEITRDRLNEQLSQLWRRDKRTVVFVTHSIAEAAYLSTRIVVMSPRPGRILKQITSPLPDERHLGMRDSPEFVAVAHELREALRRWKQNRCADDSRRLLPVAIVLAGVVVLWYLGAVCLNAPGAIERVLAPKGPVQQQPTWSSPPGRWSARCCRRRTKWRSTCGTAVVDWPLDSPRNLLYHAAVTAQSTLVGFVLGTLLGVVLAAAIVHSRTLDRALLPWIVASQTVPVLAIAPIVLVILGSLGFAGIAPKAAIAMYLCFFPVDRRDGAGPALAAAHRYRADAHLRGDADAGVLAAAHAGGACRSCSRRCASPSPPGWSARWSPSCRPARRPASARGC